MYDIKTKANNILELKYNVPAFVTTDQMADELLNIEMALLTANLATNKSTITEYLKFGNKYNRNVDDIVHDYDDECTELILQIKRIMAMLTKGNS